MQDWARRLLPWSQARSSCKLVYRLDVLLQFVLAARRLQWSNLQRLDMLSGKELWL